MKPTFPVLPILLLASTLVTAACATGSDTLPRDGAGAEPAASSSGAGGLGGDGGDVSTGGAAGVGAATSSASSSAASGGGGTGGGPPDTCGNGVLDADEACEGTDFGGKTCISLGLGGGTLTCNATCSIVLGACTLPEDCSDFEDNDSDGLSDCLDADCTGHPSCSDSCSSPLTIAIPGVSVGDTTGRPSIHAGSCNGGMSGPEAVYQVTAPFEGTMRVEVTTPAFDASLSVRTACDDAATELACSNTKHPGDFDPEVVHVDVTAGTTYFIVIDGVSPADAGSFSFFVLMPTPEAGILCTNGLDDDDDGYLDCDDPYACKGTSDCAPGAKASGESCLETSQCASADGDPICLTEALGWFEGYCSQFCDPASPDCTGDGVCAQLGLSVHGVCLDGCAGPGDCRPGYGCVDEGLASLVCRSTSEFLCNDFDDNDGDGLMDCEDPNACQLLPECTPGATPVGGNCVTSNECMANDNDPLCIYGGPPYFWPGGYCTEYCDVLADDCAPGSICADVLGLPSGTGNCFRTCNDSSICGNVQCQDVGLSAKICIL